MFHLTIPIHDTIPSFIDDGPNKDLQLLKSTAQLNGRVPTPDKRAIMELATGFDKRRLRKHQRILLDIAQRCREQEVDELSGCLTQQCSLSRQECQPGRLVRDYSFYSMITNMARQTTFNLDLRSQEPPAHGAGKSPINTADFDVIHWRQKQGNTAFPMRKVLTKRDNRLPHLQLSHSYPISVLPKLPTWTSRTVDDNSNRNNAERPMPLFLPGVEVRSKKVNGEPNESNRRFLTTKAFTAPKLQKVASKPPYRHVALYRHGASCTKLDMDMNSDTTGSSHELMVNGCTVHAISKSADECQSETKKLLTEVEDKVTDNDIKDTSKQLLDVSAQ